ncbi:hypothetical protein MMC07_009689 [Pseudocyphellaria aurata]|nr:hypothetical protein [Pseudocyphellaria aurata]
MQNLSPTSLTFYPAYCLKYSPTYNTWARLTSTDVHALQERADYEGQNIYFHLNHPIRWVRLVGVVVAFDSTPGRWFIQLDDNSGATIELTCERQTAVAATVDANDSDEARLTCSDNVIDQRNKIGVTATGRTVDFTGLDVGAVVKVKGGVGVFRGEKQVLLESLSLLCSTNEEVASWAETSAFRRDVLNVPWVLKEQDLKRAARKAEGRRRLRDVGSRQKTRKRHKGASRQKQDDEKGENGGDDGKASEVRVAAQRKKPERENPVSVRIKGRDVRIPPDQQRRLDGPESWIPAAPDQTPRAAAAREPKPGLNRTDRKDAPAQSVRTYDALGL